MDLSRPSPYRDVIPPFADLRIIRPDAIRAAPTKKLRRPITLDPAYEQAVSEVAEALREAHRGALGAPARVTESGKARIQRLLRGTETSAPIPAETLIEAIRWAASHEFWGGKMITTEALERHARKIITDTRFTQRGQARKPGFGREAFDTRDTLGMRVAASG